MARYLRDARGRFAGSTSDGEISGTKSKRVERITGTEARHPGHSPQSVHAGNRGRIAANIKAAKKGNTITTKSGKVTSPVGHKVSYVGGKKFVQGSGGKWFPAGAPGLKKKK